MPVPKGTRFRFKQVSPISRVRLAYAGGQVVEVVPYTKKRGTWVKGHTRNYPKKYGRK